MRHRTLFLSAFSTVIMAATLAGCGDNKSAPAGGGAGGMPPAEVGVITVTPGQLSLTSELPGRLEALRTADVRARVSGIVLERLFREGSDVRAGDVLYRIDAAPYRAAYDSARAAVARAEAAQMEAKLREERAQSLIGKKMISQQDFDSAMANARATQADVQAAKSALESARLNLDYATVRAPISGRIGRALVTEGALVGQGEATPLALIQQVNPLYVNFTQSSTELLRLRKALESGQLKTIGKQAEVQVVMEDGTAYPHVGKLLFSDLAVDPTTGTVALRAEVPNPDDFLLPGMFVRVRVQQAVAEKGITVPQRGVQRGPQGAFVMLVRDGVVAVQPVTTGAAQGDVWVITDGLKGGEQVIVEGLQKVQPGAPAKAIPFGNAATAPAAPAAK
ncbi:MAG: efflux RND transporter periplasmic adaptor subunit [Moraxellaceae bacterium]|mgnify:CR=1 FL=1|jgi:membrane fusion protein (multidrug efflux system)|nr:efflux RND transporter periplasmic adaptor subunit [Moraxellaceae bacterium]MBP7229528.1 efflux RND transporter periplasmic adaptor subunit [Moraxellaceae bacterium]MBP8851857.1 efflux RND transporter periplasmic adaptor subunit [Moraxellaceae bacterium]MBP9045299.1 efflux RND transporter periplasmic adaptor subunit [Moraxellaceae bacterium]MBP9730644.1 efflux RND transporter periplasmic adaptor subunit [Moraxellaceae bacterium]